MLNRLKLMTLPRGEIYDLLTTRPEDLAHERTDE